MIERISLTGSDSDSSRFIDNLLWLYLSLAPDMIENGWLWKIATDDITASSSIRSKLNFGQITLLLTLDDIVTAKRCIRWIGYVGLVTQKELIQCQCVYHTQYQPPNGS